MRRREPYALRKGLFAHNGEDYRFFAVYEIEPVARLVFLAGNVLLEACLLRKTHCLGGRLALGLCGVHEALVALAEFVSPGYLLIAHYESRIFGLFAELFGEKLACCFFLSLFLLYCHCYYPPLVRDFPCIYGKFLSPCRYSPW